MSNTMRMTGLFSGLDTESIISSLVSVKSQKVTTLKQEQEKLGWKQTIWQDVNSNVYSLYSGKLSSMRLTGAYAKKTTKVSDTTKASVVAGDTAVNGSQSLKIKSLAASGYLTGAKLKGKGTRVTDADGNETGEVKYSKLTSDDKLSDIDSTLAGTTITVQSNKNDPSTATEIEITSGMTLSSFAKKLQEAGVNASFDEGNQRFFVSSKSAGADADFIISASSTDALTALGINTDLTDDEMTAAYGANNKATRIVGQDAEIELNGATFTSNSNTFTINGLSITANAVTGDEAVSITTETDYNGIYDSIKDLLSEYNDVINDIYTRYNADSARKYNMLTEDEKEAMTDDEVEKWENTIKDSLLRRDNDLYKIMNTLTEGMSKGYEVNGEMKYLSSFGIGTLSYFEAEESERKAYHINGDSDDDKTKDQDDKLKKAIAQDPEGTIQFFANLCNNLYTSIGDVMKRSEYRSIYKVYDDKTLQKEYDSYTTKISEAQKKLEDYEDRYYDKFSAMETALSKLQSSQNTLSGMLGS